jgi:hypothetical protein
VHPTDGELLLSTEPSAEAGPVLAHVATCAVCSARLQTLQSEMDHAARALEQLDGPVPQVNARALIERATRERSEVATPDVPSRRRFPARAAAVAALLVVTGAAAALPGSPVRRWAERRFGSGDVPPAPENVQTTPASDGFGGVALPAHLPLLIILPTSVESGSLALAVALENITQVLSSDPDTGFSVGPGVLTLATRANSLQIEITAPSTMPRLMVRVGNRMVFDRDQPFATEAMARGDTLRIPLSLTRP